MMDDFDEPVVEIDAQEFTDIEKKLILEVVARDEDVRLQEKSRLDNLKIELRNLKERGVPDSKDQEYGRVCKRCRTPLGLIFNSGAFCLSCGYKVCKECRVPSENSSENPNGLLWTCSVCGMFRAIRAESGAWFYSGVEQPTAKKKVYGSMLLKRIFSIAKKRDKVIYKDPIWNDMIETNEIEALEEEDIIHEEDDDDDYLVIGTKENGQYSFSDTATANYIDEPPMHYSDQNLVEDEHANLVEENIYDTPQEHPTVPIETAAEPIDVQLYEPTDSMEPILPIEKKEEQFEAVNDKAEELVISDDEDQLPSKDLAGEILIGLKYDYNDQAFEIQIHKAKDLPPGDLAKSSSDPYVKVYLNSTSRSLGKKKTKAKKCTLNPEFDEIVVFKIKHEELITSTCDVSVWHYEFSNNNVLLGEVKISIEEFLNSGFSLENPIPNWYTLYTKRLNFTQLNFNGDLVVKINYKAPGSLVADSRREQRKMPNPTKGQLYIGIVQAKNLKSDENMCYCKISLVLSEKDTRRLQSKLVPASENPFWDEDFVIENISWAELENSFLQIVVRSKQKTATLLGCTRLGLGKSTHLKHDSFGEEVRAWQSMLNHTNEEQEFCIPLRDNIESVKQDMAVPPRTFKEISDEDYEEKRKATKDTFASSQSMKRLLNADALSMASSGSMLSIYSSAGGQNADLVVSGEVLFSMKHDINTNTFSINFEKAKCIAAANSKNMTSDPYVKVYLCPDKTKSTKKKTAHRRKTVNPVWNETIKYTITREELLKKTLHVSLWNHDRFGRNDFLGEVQLNLKHYSSSNDLGVDVPVWYTLQEMAPMSIGGVDDNKGELKVGIRFDHEVLSVHIKQANGLYAIDPENLPNPFVKCYLLPDKSRKNKRKTNVMKKTITPTWNEKFDYKGVEVNDLYSRVLEVTVWDHKTSGHQFLGGLRLGLPHGDEYWHDCFGKEVNIWEAMMKHLGILAEYAIPLRATMTSRKGQLSQEIPMITSSLDEKAPILSLSSDYPTEGPLIRISLQYIEPPVTDDVGKKKKKAKGSLKVHLKEAKNIPVKSEEDVPSTFCKGYIHPKKKNLKMKTETYIKSSNPLWDTEMVFEGVTLDELRTKVLQIDVYDEISEKKKEIIGYIRLGSGGNLEKWDDSTGIEVEIWRSMLNNPSQSVMIAVPLRLTQEVLPDEDNEEVEDFPDEDDISLGRDSEEKTEVSQAGSESPRTAALRAMGVHAANVVGMMNDDKIGGVRQETDLDTIAEEVDMSKIPDIVVSDALSFVPEEDIKPGDPPFPGAGMDRDDDFEDEVKFKQKKKQPPSFSLLKKSMSQESLTSIYSTDSMNIYGQVPIRGNIQFGMKYDYAASSFEVHVFQAKDIAAVDTKKEISDPYCKVYLLPDKTKSGKRKTTTRKKTLCPEWEEILEFKISLRDLRTRTLWLALWHLERFGRNIFLGEVMLNMDFLIDGKSDLETSTPEWYALCEKGVTPKTDLYKGEIKFSIIFEDESIFGKQTRNETDDMSKKKKKKKKETKGTGKINIHIKECSDLPAADRDGFSDPFCKCYLLPNKSSKTKRKTPIIRHTRNPVWDYKFEYPCDYEDLADHGIEFGVWDWDRGSRNDFLGCCRINLGTRVYQWDDADGVEIEAWQHLIDHPNVWREFVIPLRSKLDPRGDAKME